MSTLQRLRPRQKKRNEAQGSASPSGSAPSRRCSSQGSDRFGLGTPGGGRNGTPSEKKKARAQTNVCALTAANFKKGKDYEQAEKRKREDQLLKRILVDPLPPEFCERNLDTTWVSPITNRLAPCDRDRKALGKPESDVYHLKMALPSLTNFFQAKSSSAPDLHASHDLPRIPRRGTTPASGADDPEEVRACPSGCGFQVTWHTTHCCDKCCRTATDKDGKAHSIKCDRKAVNIGKANHTSSQNLGKSITQFGQRQALREAVAEEMMLEPPPSLQKDVVMRRLEAVGETFQINSFGNYVKEFDITSGQKKQRMDPAVMRNAETSYIKSMQALVGPPERPALKMFDSPIQMAKRRIKTKPSPAGSSSSPLGVGDEVGLTSAPLPGERLLPW